VPLRIEKFVDLVEQIKVRFRRQTNRNTHRMDYLREYWEYELSLFWTDLNNSKKPGDKMLIKLFNKWKKGSKHFNLAEKFMNYYHVRVKLHYRTVFLQCRLMQCDSPSEQN
jgi:hypothetical protein